MLVMPASGGVVGWVYLLSTASKWEHVQTNGEGGSYVCSYLVVSRDQ